MLHRAPTAAEVSAWTPAAGHGAIDSIRLSSEYAKPARLAFAALIRAGYGAAELAESPGVTCSRRRRSIDDVEHRDGEVGARAA